MSILAAEITKYEKMWAVPSYSDFSPGEKWSAAFLEIAKPKAGETVIDLGCGSGKGGQALEVAGLRVFYLDIVKHHDHTPFIQQPLWLPFTERDDAISYCEYDFGFCCDVMEHIPEQFTMAVVNNALDACGSVFFSISFVHDGFGDVIDEKLHLTVKDFKWWRDSLRELGTILEARDLLNEGIFYVSRS